METRGFGPMAGLAHGPETDFEHNDMRAILNDERQSVKQERQAQAFARYQALLSDLQGTGGESIRTVAALLAQRIDTLVSQDPEAYAYFKILSGWQQELHAGEAVTQRLTSDLFDHIQRGSHG